MAKVNRQDAANIAFKSTSNRRTVGIGEPGRLKGAWFAVILLVLLTSNDLRVRAWGCVR